MKVEYINPFINSVYNLFSTMLSAEVERGEVGIARDSQTPRHITAIIGVSGHARGTVAISFPNQTALSMVGRMLGMELRVLDDSVTDGISEIVNIVAGRAKAQFDFEPPLEISLPTVIRGNSYSVDYPSKTTWLEVPFQSELGDFILRVTFEKFSKQNNE